MRRFGKTLTGFGAARALLAGAAFLAAGQAARAEDTALAIPRISPPGDSAPVALPQPLAPSDAARVRQIFILQAKGDIPAAVAACEQLTDQTLLGAILADRYLGGPGRAQPEDLARWLRAYRDQPDAAAVYALLTTQSPKLARDIDRPEPAQALPALASGDDIEPVVRLLPRNPVLDRTIHEAARGDAARAVRLIARTRGLDRVYGAQLRAEVAQILFTQGRDTEALALATNANAQARGAVGLAPYIGGLAAWRLDRPEQSLALFEAAYRAELIQPGQRAGAAFWAARAHLHTRDAGGYAPWLHRAAQTPRTFYGLLARRALGQPIPVESTLRRATLSEADVEAVEATPAGHRAFALLQVGQDARAAAELQTLWAQTRDLPGFARSIMLVARTAGLSGLAEQLASVIEPSALHLPAAQLRPAGGFRTDPALVYALARLESNFDAGAVSPAGARGLLQLMPQTADFILGDGARVRGRSLHDPAFNLELGQRYLMQLAHNEAIGTDLIRLLASYNSGPNGFGKWVGGIHHNGDPLLFIESVPNDETRAYIPRALAYSWLYAAQLRLPSPSLDELAAGSWPRFHAEERLARLH